MIQTKTAYKLAVEALKKQIQPLAFDSNLFEHMPDYIAGERAHKTVSRLRQAIDIITEEHLTEKS